MSEEKVEEEIWKLIDGYEEEKYEISNFGRVRRWTKGYCKGGLVLLKEPRYIKSGIHNCKGYDREIIHLWKNSKKINKGIHRIVAETFIKNPKPDEYKLVDHIDGNMLNNCYTNLRWCNPHLNNLNMKLRCDNKSGRKGVCWDKNKNKWVVQMKINGKNINGGRFVNLDDAIKRREYLEKEYYNQYFFIEKR